MSLQSKTLPGFWNGVSQQPASQRLETMAELQENAIGTLVDGLYPRPGSTYRNVLTSKAAPGTFTYGINLGASDKYLMALTGDWDEPVEVFSLIDGSKKTVTVDRIAKSYLFNNMVLNPHFEEDTLVQTSPPGEYTPSWLAYNGATLARAGAWYMTITGGATAYPGAKQTITGFVPGRQYQLRYLYNATTNFSISHRIETVGGAQVAIGITEVAGGQWLWKSISFTATDTTHVLKLDIYDGSPNGKVLCIGDVYLYLQAEVTPKAMFRATTLRDLILVTNVLTPTSSMPEKITAAAITGVVQKFTDLPVSPTQGDIYEIRGTGDDSFAGYYVTWTGDVWEECLAPGGNIDQPRAASMPHKLVKNADGTFTFTQWAGWDGRTVGDTTTSKKPSFLGYTINAVFFRKNRLCFLSRDNVICSIVGQYQNFYAPTVTEVYDTDPIDTTVAMDQADTLIHAVSFNREIFLFASEQQNAFGAAGDNALTPATANSDPVTRFKCATVGTPEVVGPNVYFASPKDSYAAIREYFIKPDAMLTDAPDITAHVPQYIEDGEFVFTSCSALDMLFVHSSATPEKIYFYKFYWVGDEKMQSAWSSWTFDGDVVGMTCMGTTLHLLIRREYATNTYQTNLESLQLENTLNTGLDFRVDLDRLVSAPSAAYNAGTGRTAITLPYYDTAASLSDYCVIDASTGLKYPVVATANYNTLYIQGNHTSLIVGRNYTMRYRLSEWVKKDGQNRPILSGRLQIRKLHLDVVNSGYLRVEVTPVNREVVGDPVEAERTAQLVSVARLNNIDFISGRLEFVVMAKAQGTRIEIVNDSYLPCFVQTGELEGFFWNRTRSRSA